MKEWREPLATNSHRVVVMQSRDVVTPYNVI